jgi:NADPH2:quinone reductase
VIFDNAGAALGPAAFALLAEGGRFSAHSAASGPTSLDEDAVRERHATATGIEPVQLSPAQIAPLSAEAFARAVAGELAPVVGQTFALSDAAAAHAAIEARSVFGKTLLFT